MVFHPRENWHLRKGRSPFDPLNRAQRRALSRRDFLRLTGGSALAAAWLAACGGGETTTTPGAGGAGGVRVGTPDNPVTQPIFDDNPPIEDNLEQEAGPLHIFNWADYIWPRVLNDFSEEFGVEVELSTFYNLEEAIRKMRSGEVAYDVFFPTGENIPKLIAGKLLQPLNHSYLPNLQANVWPMLADPFYDKGSLYTVPYAVYQTGIGWREDIAKSTPEDFENPWDSLWDPANAGISGFYDDYRETMGIGMYHAGIMDINGAEGLDTAKQELLNAVETMNPAFTIDGAYIRLPEGRLGVVHAWSGDVAAAPYYAPKGEDPSTLRWMWPPKHSGFQGGYVSNDAIGIPTTSQNPVLAHMFLNYMLDQKVALKNFSWVLYQPPQNAIEPESLVSEGYIPENVASTVIQQEDFELGQIPIQLTPQEDAAWLEAWSEVQAG
jgi:spermidine/putrescine transport system substrate-binding protein